MIEETFYFDEPFWANDDLWAAHYQLVTGYDDAKKIFIGQDSFHGANQEIPYQRLDEYWQAFNRLYIVVYQPGQEATVQAILADNWDPDVNRQHALEAAEMETQTDPDNAFAWFNLGANLVYFERYDEAAAAFDQARAIGLPQRMLRYQFSPFFAYFYTRRMEDLAAISDYALQITKNSEEALLWRGWGLFRQGDSVAALESFQQALAENPNYQDARYAIDFVKANP
jgi:tetratricopeptide (TPR) repeat protein